MSLLRLRARVVLKDYCSLLAPVQNILVSFLALNFSFAGAQVGHLLQQPVCTPHMRAHGLVFLSNHVIFLAYAGCALQSCTRTPFLD